MLACPSPAAAIRVCVFLGQFLFGSQSTKVALEDIRFDQVTIDDVEVYPGSSFKLRVMPIPKKDLLDLQITGRDIFDRFSGTIYFKVQQGEFTAELHVSKIKDGHLFLSTESFPENCNELRFCFIVWDCNKREIVFSDSKFKEYEGNRTFKHLDNLAHVYELLIRAWHKFNQRCGGIPQIERDEFVDIVVECDY